MKVVRMIATVTGLFACVLTGVSAQGADELGHDRVPTSGEVMRLVTIAWTPVPESFEVEYFKTVRYSVFNEELHRWGLTRAMELEKTDPGAPDRSDAERQAWVEERIDRLRKENRDGKRTFGRIRKRGFLTRWDTGHAAPGEELSLQTPFEETYLQLYDPQAGRFKGMVMHHGVSQTADVFSDPRRKRHIDEAWDWGRFPVGQATVLQMATCRIGYESGVEVPITDEDGELIMDAQRIEQLQQQRHPMLSITCRDITVDDVPCVTFTFGMKQIERHGLEITCWKSDYSVVPAVRGFDIETGAVSVEMNASDFNTQATPVYPRVLRTERSASHGGKMFEQIVIHSMSSPADFPDSDLEFVPPRGYLWTDSRSGEPQFIGHPPGLEHLDTNAIPTGRRFGWFIVFNVLIVAVPVVIGTWVRFRRRAA